MIRLDQFKLFLWNVGLARSRLIVDQFIASIGSIMTPIFDIFSPMLIFCWKKQNEKNSYSIFLYQFIKYQKSYVSKGQNQGRRVTFGNQRGERWVQGKIAGAPLILSFYCIFMWHFPKFSQFWNPLGGVI